MRTISFHKKEETALCLFCKVNRVALKDWNKRCEECRAIRKKEEDEEMSVTVGKRDPAAIIETDGGQEIYVDKFGKEVPNPGYDLSKDPRGWKKNGYLPQGKTII